MRLTVRGKEVFVSTGGRDWTEYRDPAVMFIHGSGQNHLSFLLQARYLANRGYLVVNPDMPGHGHSEGPALTSIEDMADWYLEVASAMGLQSATLIGHSQGGLVQLEISKKDQESGTGFVDNNIFIATALAIPVNDMLLGLAKEKEASAISAMTDWGHGTNAHLHDNSMPGMTHLYFGQQLMAANQSGALYADLKACADYTGGADAAKAAGVSRCLAILGHQDKMTPIKAGRALAAATNADVVEIPHSGHMMPNEAPDEVNAAMKDFLMKDATHAF
ncbi:MAG: alpha/beta hydrolase [Pseudomonadota bacterium]